VTDDPATPPPFRRDRYQGYGSDPYRSDRPLDRGAASGLNRMRDAFGSRRGPYQGEDPAMYDRSHQDSSGYAHGGDQLYRSPNPHRLYRNREEGKLGGICAGIADYINVDAWIVRIGALLGLIFFPPPFLFGYFLLWWILKPRPSHLFDSKEEEVFWRSVATKPDQTLAGIKSKFRELDRQISTLEGYVASREFDLDRQFKDLERK